jgi:branched-chain amino acid transport system ATP-binding protein
MSERAADSSTALLRVQDLAAWYGETQALERIDLEVRRGEVVCLLGRNGAGKTTTLRAIMGLIGMSGMQGRCTGRIEISGAPALGIPPEEVARLGVAYCPEERGIYASLSVEENLLLPPVLAPGGLTLEEIYTLFPNLLARRKSGGSKLSGGEQQMLAIARILRTGAKLLLLDEPTEGLAPVIVQAIGQTIRSLRERGFTILMVEQNFRFASRLGDRFYVIEEGRVALHLDRATLEADRTRVETLLGV